MTSCHKKSEETLIKLEDPDFVAFSGDVISDYGWEERSKNCFLNGSKHCWLSATEVVNRNSRAEGGRPYAPLPLATMTLESLISRHMSSLSLTCLFRILTAKQPLETFLTRQTTYSKCTTPKGQLLCYACGSWIVAITNVKASRGTIVCFQTKSSGTDACPKSSTRNIKPLASLFCTSPLQEHMNLWNYHPTNGTKNETVCCSSLNTGLYAAFKEMGDIKFVTVGHDHNNDYIGDYYGITLAYGRKTGYGGYFNDCGSRGGRVLEFNATNNVISTWIREELGAKVIQTASPSSGKKQLQLVCYDSPGVGEGAAWWARHDKKQCQNKECI